MIEESFRDQHIEIPTLALAHVNFYEMDSCHVVDLDDSAPRLGQIRVQVPYLAPIECHPLDGYFIAILKVVEEGSIDALRSDKISFHLVHDTLLVELLYGAMDESVNGTFQVSLFYMKITLVGVILSFELQANVFKHFLGGPEIRRILDCESCEIHVMPPSGT